jgi:hypothetical protein
LKKTLVRVTSAAFAGALITVAVSPAALAQDETSSTTTTTSSTTTSSDSVTTTTSEPAATGTTSTTAPAPTTTTDVKTTEAIERGIVEEPTSDEPAPPKDPVQDNTGHGWVRLDGEGTLVIVCAEGAPGDVATVNLSVTGGPDQDESDGRLWDYSVRLVGPVTGPTAPFSWTCGGKPGQGVVEYEQAPPPTTTTSPSPTSTAPASSTAPITTGPAGNSAPQAQVKVTPKGGIETGFGGMARD